MITDNILRFAKSKDKGLYETLVFCTKGNNGKEALQSLLKYSSDFNWLKNRELDNMIIRVRRCQTKRS